VVHNAVIIGMPSITVIKSRISNKYIQKISGYLVTEDLKHEKSHLHFVNFTYFSDAKYGKQRISVSIPMSSCYDANCVFLSFYQVSSSKATACPCNVT